MNGRGEGGDEIGISNRLGDVLGSAVEAKLLREVKQHPAKVDHLAIIMDGNRRFAWSKALETDIGHKMGKMKLEQVLDWVLELEIHYFTVYALSTENLNRPETELEGLFNLYIEGLKDIADDERIHQNKVKVQIIGRRELLPESVIDKPLTSSLIYRLNVVLPLLFVLELMDDKLFALGFSNCRTDLS